MTSDSRIVCRNAGSLVIARPAESARRNLPGTVAGMEARIAISSPGMDVAVQGSDETAQRQRVDMQAVIENAGGVVVPVEQANALLWLSLDALPLCDLLDENPQIQWVQLPWAGVERFAQAGLFGRQVTFTCAKAAFAGLVAEHAFTLMLSCLHNVVEQARTPRWNHQEPVSLEKKRVTILGAGGIATRLMRFLRVADCDVTVVRRNQDPVEGANRTMPISELHSVLPQTDVLVLALPLTSESANIIGQAELALLPSQSILVNVSRGGLVDTDALVEALSNGRLRAAGLDVTAPEPLPDDHPLWVMNNVLITSHSADSLEYRTQKLAERVSINVQRFQSGQPLVGVVDPAAGY